LFTRSVRHFGNPFFVPLSELPQQPQRIGQLVRPIYRFVLEHHEIAELTSSLFLPGIAQLQLADGIRVVPVNNGFSL